MKPIHEQLATSPSMDSTCATTLEEIDRRLQKLASTFLPGNSEFHKGPEGSNPYAGSVDLTMLQAMPLSTLVRRPDSVAVLAEICRLLFKRGDHGSLELAQGLAHKIYGLTRARQGPGQIFYLFKGIAEIGLGSLEIGIKNVSTGLAANPTAALQHADLCLGYWSLMSAAVGCRELQRALQLAEDWRAAAEAGSLEGEVFRSRMALQIFNLLMGNRERSVRDMTALAAAAPEECRETTEAVKAWTALMAAESLPTGAGPPAWPSTFAGPYPLFLGFEWYHPGLLSLDDLSEGDFAVLCRLRRDFCDGKTVANFTVDELAACAELAADWELPRFLREIEVVLKERDPERYIQFSMGRVLGKPAVEGLTCPCGNDAGETLVRDNMILWVMDVRGYTTLAEHWSAEQNFTLLSPLFKIVNEELERTGGVLLEFAGDCIVIAFNTPYAPTTVIEKVLFQTARCFRRLHALNALAMQTGSPEVKIGIGIDRGAAAIGFLGGLSRCHLSILGSTVNQAARIEQQTKSLDRPVLVSAQCFDGEEPEVWREPQLVTYSVRHAGLRKLRHVSKPLQLFAVSPLLPYWVDFVPMGFVAYPEPGIVYIDTGNSDRPGIIDHHFEAHRADSACELLIRQPELLVGHLQDIPASQIELRLHQGPDLDCAATLYAACELLHKRPRLQLLEKLARYVSSVDQGIVPNPGHLSDSLYGVFTAHQTLVEMQHQRRLTDFMLLEAQLRVIDAAMYLMEKHRRSADPSRIFRFKPDWFAEERRLIENDQAIYREDLRVRSRTYKARVRGLPEPVEGLWLDHPQSLIFKLWVRTDPNAPGGRGYPFLAVDWSQPDKNRFVISVDPESGTDLKGLGELLETAEEKKRTTLGLQRPPEPRRYPTNNSDPWYFGWGHAYTIIDSPREGTVLAGDEVREIHEGWSP